ncbi:inositol phosphorylceramide synthase [Paraherbaspirillum soli]|uniref:Inositol phosphorylceramide synthase n=1 Tax=Paraherbaspirillum soli TaxID=631222 RepID=A0ABW0MCE0_9BURK
MFKPIKLQLWPRLRQMLLGWGCVGVAYTLGSLWQGHAMVLPETALDRMIPFNPVGVWFYLSFFVLIPVTYLVAEFDRLRWLTAAMQVCAVVSGIFFIAWPTTLHYPSISGDGLSVALLRLLSAADSSHNCLPSLHGALTLLCVWALVDARCWLRSIFAVVCGLCICFSIIQLRRHISIDLGAGLLTGLMSGWLCQLQAATRPDNKVLPL